MQHMLEGWFSVHKRVGLIWGKCSPAGSRMEAGTPSEQLFPVQILTPLCYNPAPWERLCPLFGIFSVSSVVTQINTPSQMRHKPASSQSYEIKNMQI